MRITSRTCEGIYEKIKYLTQSFLSHYITFQFWTLKDLTMIALLFITFEFEKDFFNDVALASVFIIN